MNIRHSLPLTHTHSSTWDLFKTYILHPIPQRGFSKVAAYFWSNSTKWPGAPNFNGLYQPRRDGRCNINLCLLKPRAGNALHLLSFWKRTVWGVFFPYPKPPAFTSSRGCFREQLRAFPGAGTEAKEFFLPVCWGCSMCIYSL